MVCEKSSAIPVNVPPIAAAGQGTRQKPTAIRHSEADRHGMRQESFLPGIVQQCYSHSIKLKEHRFSGLLLSARSAAIFFTAAIFFNANAFFTKALALMPFKVPGPVTAPLQSTAHL